MRDKDPLTLALPKGRLDERVREFLDHMGISFDFGRRELAATSVDGSLRAMLVKNADLPTYVHHSVGGLGVCGDDVLYESGYDFVKLFTFSFGQTKMCLAGKEGSSIDTSGGVLTVASKFTRFTRDYFHEQGIPVQVIKLGGSVELAPVLGLAPYIVDLVETGSTLRANKLEVIQELKPISVHLVANPSYYKYHHRAIDQLVRRMEDAQR